MIALVDYGVGNLFSLKSSLAFIGQEAQVTSDPATLLAADRVILPGVGAFGDAIARLRESGLDSTVRTLAENGTPLLGICLGMQLLFDDSYEYGHHQGLGLIPGSVRPLEGAIPSNLSIPHIGWNKLDVRRGPDGQAASPLFAGLEPGSSVYFVHSYYACECEPYVIATAEYGIPVTAAVQKGNVFGCQFHPEKSGAVGLEILRSFCETKRA